VVRLVCSFGTEPGRPHKTYWLIVRNNSRSDIFIIGLWAIKLSNCRLHAKLIVYLYLIACSTAVTDLALKIVRSHLTTRLRVSKFVVWLMAYRFGSLRTHRLLRPTRRYSLVWRHIPVGRIRADRRDERCTSRTTDCSTACATAAALLRATSRNRSAHTTSDRQPLHDQCCRPRVRLTGAWFRVFLSQVTSRKVKWSRSTRSGCCSAKPCRATFVR
jgi:hypothetical protein